ncbi:MAG: hypothetical protein R3228_07060 [Halioglobus sp.]|nr:hypothetical protein [Halioglobus sp.]
MRLLRWTATALLLLLVVLATAPFVIVFLGIEQKARVVPVAGATAGDVARLRDLLRYQDPRYLSHGARSSAALTERDINLGLGASPYSDRLTARVAITPGLAMLHSSVRLPANPRGNYFNASLMVSESRGQLALEELQVGPVTLPGMLLAPAAALLDHLLRARLPEYDRVRRALRAVWLQERAVQLDYQWDEVLARQLEARGRDAVMPAHEREAFAAYYREAVENSRRARRGASLDALLQPLFALASRRSVGGDTAKENRALLLVVGTVVRGASAQLLLGEEQAQRLGRVRAVGWTLQGRADLAQHFGISAALAVAGGSALADAIGVFKELDDSRGGTGFSFVDLLADRAGVALAERATGARADAVQRLLGGPGLREEDYMPDIALLPEGLLELTFLRRYGDLDDPRYAAAQAEIERRIAALPVHATR